MTSSVEAERRRAGPAPRGRKGVPAARPTAPRADGSYEPLGLSIESILSERTILEMHRAMERSAERSAKRGKTDPGRDRGATRASARPGVASWCGVGDDEDEDDDDGEASRDGRSSSSRRDASREVLTSKPGARSGRSSSSENVLWYVYLLTAFPEDGEATAEVMSDRDFDNIRFKHKLFHRSRPSTSSSISAASHPVPWVVVPPAAEPDAGARTGNDDPSDASPALEIDVAPPRRTPEPSSPAYVEGSAGAWRRDRARRHPAAPFDRAARPAKILSMLLVCRNHTEMQIEQIKADWRDLSRSRELKHRVQSGIVLAKRHGLPVLFSEEHLRGPRLLEEASAFYEAQRPIRDEMGIPS